MTNWQPLTPSDVPHFVETLRHYPLSMDDTALKYPLQYFTLRLNSCDTEYVKVPGMGYMALDPILPHDAVIHFARDPTSRAKKRNYLDMGKSFMLWTFNTCQLNRITLAVVEGSYLGRVPFDLYAKMLGFTHEGTLRQSRIINEKLYDVHIFGILRGEV